MRFFYACISVLMLSGCVTTTFASSKTLSSDSRTIALVSPDVELSVLNAGGITEPHAAWTKNAKEYLNESIRSKFHAMGIQLSDNAEIIEISTDDPQEVQLLKLHEAVGGAILSHQFPGPFMLPSKKNNFKWTLGESSKHLRQKYGADYALFIYVRDSYASAGRVAVIMVGALLGFGVSGGTQVGFASLVDLSNGEIIWFNRLLRGGGDLRTQQASQETISLLLNDFPR